MAERAQEDPPYPRLWSALHTPDSEDWRLRRGYSSMLAAALRHAYARLHGSRRDNAYFDAFVALIPFRKMEMCAEQRLRFEYALALAYAGENAPEQALGAVERALEAAEDLEDEVAPVELGYLAGALAHGLSEQALAHGLYAEALNGLRRLERDGVSADPMLELDLALRLGWRAWELGRFPQSLRYLDEAYSLRAQWPKTTPSHAASLSWLDAQLARVRGNLARAVEMALPAASLLMEVGQTLNAGRAHAFLAECSTELAQSSSVDDPKAALGLARDAARRAGSLAREAGDRAGREIARLAGLQASRVELKRRGGTGGVNNMPALGRGLGVAEELRDMALTGRVETAIGDELAAQGDREAARAMYLRARLRLEEHDLGGLAYWSRRALGQLDGL